MWSSKPLPDPSDIYAALPGIINLQPLSGGGQKAVYRARHVDFGDVVIKLFRGDPADERLRREIEAVTTGSFSNVPRIYATGVVAHGGHQTAHVVEQFIDGETLRAVLDRERVLPVATILALTVLC